jgi:hypothetical protein
MVGKHVLVPFVLAAIAGTPAFALVQLERQVGPERIEDAESSVAVVLEGFVDGPDGAPVEGAVVVSSAGGRAVSDASGHFRLETKVPLGAESVQLTAAGGKSAGLTTSRRVELPGWAGTVRVGSLELAMGSSCSPEWLPTFGGAPGTTSSIRAVAVYDDGGGSALYVGGAFFIAGGVQANSIAKWDGSSWTALGSGMNDRVNALIVFDDGGGPALYAGGRFTTAGGVAAKGIAKWDGSSWAPLGGGITSEVHSLAVHDDGSGPALYAGGALSSAGGVAMSGIAKWDGSSWTALGSGVSGAVYALAEFDDGSGPALHAGGFFTSAGGVAANRIAKWDGSSWTALGSGLTGGGNTRVEALAVYDAGSGPRLYAGGQFNTAGGVPANGIARWNGSSWTTVSSGTDKNVLSLGVHDDGSGPALYAGGAFTTAGGVPASRIAKWDGSSWSALGSGLSDHIYALAVYDDGYGPALYAGGSALDSGDAYLSKWGCAVPAPTAYCTAGTSASGCQALLAATGTPSATATSGFSLLASGVEGQKDALYFFGTNGKQANSWGNGTSYQCVVPPVTRAGTLSGSGTIGTCDGSFAQDLNALWCPSCPKPQKNPGAAAVVQAQLWYRDPLSTSNQTTSLSDAIEFVVSP